MIPRLRTQWLALLVVTLAVGLAWISATRVSATDINPTGRPPQPVAGHPAPDFQLVSLDGETRSLAEFRGRTVILNFWATWCGPCRVEIPALEATWQGYGGEVVIIGVNIREDAATVSRYVDELGVSYPVLLDTDGTVGRLYNVQAFPTTYIISPDGVVIEPYTGMLSEPLLRTRLADLGASPVEGVE